MSLQSNKPCGSASRRYVYMVRRKAYIASVPAITAAIWGHIISIYMNYCHETSCIYTKKRAGNPRGSWAIDSRPAGRNECGENQPAEPRPWQKHHQCCTVVFGHGHGHH